MNLHSMLHERHGRISFKLPENAHPMAVLSSMAVSLSTFYPEVERTESIDMTATRLLSKLRTIAAFSYKKSVGEPSFIQATSIPTAKTFSI